MSPEITSDMHFIELSPGIVLIGRFGWLQTGVWLLYHNDECILMEMPDYDPESHPPHPWDYAKEFIQHKRFNLKFITASHAHLDHIDSFHQFHEAFPQTPIVWHHSFFEEGSYFNKHLVKKFFSSKDFEISSKTIKEQPSLLYQNVPIWCFNQEIFTCYVSGEPLFLIHAPKHSRSDTMVIFRGVMISGDWWWGPGDPNPNHIEKEIIRSSIKRLMNFSIRANYRIHSIFSVHANEFRKNIDFQKLLLETMS